MEARRVNRNGWPPTACDDWWPQTVLMSGQASPNQQAAGRKPRALGLLAAARRKGAVMSKKKKSKAAGKAAAQAEKKRTSAVTKGKKH